MPILSFFCFNLYGRKSGFISTLDKGLLCLETHPGKKKTGKGRTECCWETRRQAMRSPLESKYSVQQDEDLSFHMQSRVTGFTGRALFMALFANQLFLRSPAPLEIRLPWCDCAAHGPCRELGIPSGQKGASPTGCWLQNETQCSLCAQPTGSSGVWGQQLLLSLQAQLGMGEIPLDAPFAEAGAPMPHAGACPQERVFWGRQVQRMPGRWRAGRATRNTPPAPPAPLPHTSTCGTGRHIPCRKQTALVIPFSFLLPFEGERQDFLK